MCYHDNIRNIKNISDLIHKLHMESAHFRLQNIEAKLAELRNLQAKSHSPLRALQIYNYEAFLELQSITLGEESMTIDEKRLYEMEECINNYMKKHMPENEEYSCFIRIVSVYQSFIACRPLHPPGMFNTDGQAVYNNGSVVCPLRSTEILNPNSLCRFCVSTT